jgi:hypothetical protein
MELHHNYQQLKNGMKRKRNSTKQTWFAEEYRYLLYIAVGNNPGID